MTSSPSDVNKIYIDNFYNDSVLRFPFKAF